MTSMIQHFINNLLKGQYDVYPKNYFRLNKDYTLMTQKQDSGYKVWLEHDGKSIHNFTIAGEPQDAYNIDKESNIIHLGEQMVRDVVKYERGLKWQHNKH